MTIKFNSAEKNQFLNNYSDKEKTTKLATAIIEKILGGMEEKLDKPIDSFSVAEVDEAMTELRAFYKAELSFKVAMIVIQDFLREHKIISEATEYILGMEFKSKPSCN